MENDFLKGYLSNHLTFLTFKDCLRPDLEGDRESPMLSIYPDFPIQSAEWTMLMVILFRGQAVSTALLFPFNNDYQFPWNRFGEIDKLSFRKCHNGSAWLKFSTGHDIGKSGVLLDLLELNHSKSCQCRGFIHYNNAVCICWLHTVGFTYSSYES